MADPPKTVLALSVSLIIRLIILSAPVSLQGLAAGCGQTSSLTQRSEVPVAITFVKGVSWDHPDEGFDPDLPGYHLAGGIGAIRITAPTLPSELVLEIRTTIALRPNLEGFTMQWGDTLLQIAPFAPESVAELVIDPGPDGGRRRQPIDQDFFEFSREENAVQIRFLPRALRLLAGGCMISWVDWYRR